LANAESSLQKCDHIFEDTESWEHVLVMQNLTVWVPTANRHKQMSLCVHIIKLVQLMQCNLKVWEYQQVQLSDMKPAANFNCGEAVVWLLNYAPQTPKKSIISKRLNKMKTNYTKHERLLNRWQNLHK